MIDTCSTVPILACLFAVIISPLLIYTYSDFQALEARPENRIFWPAMAAIAVVLAAQHRSRLARLTWPPHIISLFAYLAFAGASVLWAFSPERSLIRFLQQVMIVTSIVVPAMLATREADIIRALFICFAFALVLNVFFVLDGSVTLASYNSGLVNIGYQGYFLGKNYLGECAAIAVLLSLHEMHYRGWRRALGVIVAALAIVLVVMSDSKTALVLVIISPFLSLLTLKIKKLTRISPALILLSIPIFYVMVSRLSHVDIMNRMAYMLYHNSTLTGRTIIWEFAQYEIGVRPLLGWGYQSFWLVPASPSMDAPGFVKMMPNAHNGYYDTMLEMGYVGVVFLVVFIIATLHAIGRVADRNLARARLLLSLALFIIMWNYFESLWMRGFEFLWVVFVIVAAEIGRYWQPFPLRRSRPRGARPLSLEASLGTRSPRLGTRPS